MPPTYLTISIAVVVIMDAGVVAYWPFAWKGVPLAQPGDHACQQIARFNEPVTVSETVIAHHRIYYVPCGDFLKLFACTVRRPVYRVDYRKEMRSGYRVSRVCCPGYALIGAMCHPCVPGTYGINCTFRCPKLCMQGDYGTCTPMDGRCTCLPGYYGVNCDEECPPERYGAECTGRCRCASGTTCNRVTGACPCNPGNRNEQCLQAMQSKSGSHTRSSNLSMLLFTMAHFILNRLSENFL